MHKMTRLFRVTLFYEHLARVHPHEDRVAMLVPASSEEYALAKAKKMSTSYVVDHLTGHAISSVEPGNRTSDPGATGHIIPHVRYAAKRTAHEVS